MSEASIPVKVAVLENRMARADKRMEGIDTKLDNIQTTLDLMTGGRRAIWGAFAAIGVLVSAVYGVVQIFKHFLKG